jgi:ATP-binding cassette subfamily C protein CydD
MKVTEPLYEDARGMLLGAGLLDLAAVGATIGQVAALAAVLQPVLLLQQSLGDVAAPAALLVALTLLRAALLGAREVAGQRAAVRVKSSARINVFDRLVHLGPSMVRGERTGEVITLLGDGIERLDGYVSRYLPQKVLSVTGPLLVAAYVAWLDPLSAGLLLLSAPVIPVLMVAVGSYTDEHVRSQWISLGRLSAYILDVMQGLPTLKLLWRAEAEGNRLESLSTAFRIRTLRALRYAFLSSFVLELMTTGAIAVVAVELGLRLLDAAIGFAATLQVLLLAPEFYRPLRELGAQRHAAMETRPVAERIQSVLALPLAPGQALSSGDGWSAAETHASPELPAECPRGSGGLALEFRHVSYAYPEASGLAVNNVSFCLAPRTRTALVGPSGAGKSTLASLLLRFVEPTSGAILAEGVPIDRLSVEQWRERLALVPQRPYLFDDSALENLRLARPSATMEEVEYAAELAGAHCFIQQLPDGYHTRLGERGTRLSGGQAQRLAIARAFLKAAPLLILDEPTSALDTESERDVRHALERLANRCTVLLIAHRLNTVMTADQIVVLRSGEVVECGTHRDLVASGGLYTRLVNPAPELVAA